MTRFWREADNYGKASADLPLRLAMELGATSSVKASLSNWSVTPDEWRCPCCARSKSEFVRLDRNGCMVGPIVEHHDHIHEYASGIGKLNAAMACDKDLSGEIGEYLEKRRKVSASLDSLIRFPRTWICGDCNNVDTAAKSYVGAPKWFSFSPFEIRLFVVPRYRKSNDIKPEIVREVYEYGFAQAEMLRRRYDDIADAFNAKMMSFHDDADEHEMVHVGQAAWNVLKQANNARKAQ